MGAARLGPAVIRTRLSRTWTPGRCPPRPSRPCPGLCRQPAHQHREPSPTPRAEVRFMDVTPLPPAVVVRQQWRKLQSSAGFYCARHGGALCTALGVVRSAGPGACSLVSLRCLEKLPLKAVVAGRPSCRAVGHLGRCRTQGGDAPCRLRQAPVAAGLAGQRQVSEGPTLQTVASPELPAATGHSTPTSASSCPQALGGGWWCRGNPGVQWGDGGSETRASGRWHCLVLARPRALCWMLQSLTSSSSLQHSQGSSLDL